MPSFKDGPHNIMPKASELSHRPTARGKYGWWIVICLLLAGGLAWGIRKRNGNDEQKAMGAKRMELPPVPVVAGVVIQKDVPIYLEGLGTVQAFNTVVIRARVDGQIKKVAFVEGQEVHAGDLLVQIDPDPYRTLMEQAMAKKGQDEAQLANARIDVKRYADLLANEGVTQQVYDTQKALVNQLEAAVNADQAAIDSAKVQLDYTAITSPIDGRTGLRLMDQGNIVRASDTNGLVVVTQLRPISVVFYLPMQMLGRIQQQISTSGGLTVVAVDGDNHTVLGEGKLDVIDNQIDTTTAQIKCKATFANTDLRLWPGQWINARLLLTIRKGSAVVPASVIQRGPEGAFAFVINEEQKVEVRKVVVAQIEQGEALIEDGLSPGERVVVDGQYKLQNGSRIRTADSPATAKSGRGRGAKPTGAGEARGQRGSKPTPESAGRAGQPVDKAKP